MTPLKTGLMVSVFALVAPLALMVQAAHATPLDDKVDGALPLVREAYTYLHQNPELGKKEFKAHDFLKAKLQGLGYTHFVESKTVPTAVIAVLDTGRPGPVIALRAEMDARPLPAGVNEPETNAVHSLIPGVMHNCGHDIHASILLGTASILMREKDRLKGKIVILFQPAEEVAGGADDIVNEHILDDLGVQKIFAEHVSPGLPVGTVQVGAGPILAGSNYFTLTLNGRGAHAAEPSAGDEVLLAGTRIAQLISEAPARRFDIANRPVVVSLTKFVADSGATNALPSSVTMEGTIRAFEDLKTAPEDGASVEATLIGLIDGEAKASHLTYTWSLRKGSPPTVNNPALFQAVLKPLQSSFPGTVDTNPYKGMASEDFAYYTAHIQALYFSLGITKDGLGMGSLHTAAFTASPDTFRYGLSLMTRLGEIGVGN